MQWCCFVRQAVQFFDAHEGVAAWMQFVGAVLAIFASWAFAHSEGRRATAELNETRRMEAAAEQRDRAKADAALQAHFLSAFVLLHLAQRKAGDALLLIENHPSELLRVARLAGGDLRAVATQLVAFPLPDLGSVQPINIVASAALVVGKLENLLRDVATRTDFSGAEFQLFASATAIGIKGMRDDLIRMRDDLHAEFVARWPGVTINVEPFVDSPPAADPPGA